MSVLARHNVKIYGEGTQPLVFAHGYGCDQNVWRHVAPAFADRFKVVLLDFIGAGKADRAAWDKTHHGSLQGHAHDLLDVCDAAGLDRPIVIGHSVAAMIAVTAARLEPERFARLVLLAPNPCFIDDSGYQGGFSRDDIDSLFDTLDSNYFSWAQMMAPVVMGNADRPELAEDLANSFCATDPEIARHFARVTFLSDSRPDLAHVQVPTLVLQCADDALAPPSVGDWVHRAIAGSELVRLQATGHCPHLSASDETVAAMRRFLVADLPTDAVSGALAGIQA